MAISLDVKGGIITGGLGRPACKGLITMGTFSLWCEVVPVKEKGGNSGGSIPLAPGEIAGLYQPVEGGSSAVGLPGGEGALVNPAAYGKRVVRVAVRLNDRLFEKEYLVSDNRAKHVIKIVNLINATRTKMMVMASNIKRITTNAVVKVQNLRVKYFK